MVKISGHTTSGFEPVREAFESNFERHGDVGAAIAIYVGGELVVDLTGGIRNADTGDPWTEDTLQLVFSTTKGLTTTAAHLLVERGELDLDAPVADYWPEFKAAGKGSITVRTVMCHRAGIPVIDTKLSPADVFAWDPFIDAIAAQAPAWEPGTAHGYHHFTMGYIVGEIVRRISGRSPGTFFAENVAGPLGLETYIGLPPQLEDRVATLIFPDLASFNPDVVAQLPEAQRRRAMAMADPNGLPLRATQIAEPQFDFNSSELHAAEMPPANGIATARSLAKMYASLIGEVDGARLLSRSTIDEARRCHSDGDDLILLRPTRFGLGYALSSAFHPMLGEGSFGHSGAGGSLAFAHPERGVAFAYVMNKMRMDPDGDPRTIELTRAVDKALS